VISVNADIPSDDGVTRDATRLAADLEAIGVSLRLLDRYPSRSTLGAEMSTLA
jgi:hypothetical protein